MDYTTIIFQDTTTDGDPCWVGITPALPGCVGMGMTIEEADQSLREAMADYITRLVEDGLPVPPMETTWARITTVTA